MTSWTDPRLREHDPRALEAHLPNQSSIAARKLVYTKLPKPWSEIGSKQTRTDSIFCSTAIIRNGFARYSKLSFNADSTLYSRGSPIKDNLWKPVSELLSILVYGVNDSSGVPADQGGHGVNDLTSGRMEARLSCAQVRAVHVATSTFCVGVPSGCVPR